LVEFATTGEFNFSKLVDSILSDVARLLARQALSGFLGALTGGAFGFEGTAGDFFFGGGKAAGGPVMNDRSYLVGERGPEMFTPSVPGQITPAPQTAAMMAPQAPPQVNVQVVNVTDPEEVSAALNTPGTQDQIVNVIRRNRQSVRSALGI
jgi:phage-related minor tail protein